MNDAAFDRIARAFGTRLSRRGALLGAGAAAIGAGRAVSANQLTPATCGASGDVCTMLMGCCDGLTCVTSSINVNYGVCVAGEGGTVSIGTTLISPFSENVEEEVAAIAASDTSSTTTTTDPTVEREQRLAEIKARKDARQSEQKTRRTTKRNEQQTRRDTQQTNRDLRRGPKLAFQVFNSGGVNSSGQPAVETVKITNQDEDDVYLNRIESLPPPGIFADLKVGTSSGYVLEPNKSFMFLSRDDNDLIGNRFEWIADPICKGIDPGEGFVVSLSTGVNSDSREYTILCNGSKTVPSDGNNKRKNRRRKQKNKN